MSVTPIVKNLVRLSLLERVSPELLVRFLRPWEGYLAARGGLPDQRTGGSRQARFVPRASSFV